MATVAIQYAASTTIDCTISGLASSSTICRSSNFVDNTVNLYTDALLNIAVKTAGGTAQAADKAVFVYIYGAVGGTNYSASVGEAVGIDQPVQLMSPSNLLGPVTIATPGTSQTYGQTIPIAQFFGGRLPPRWGFVIRNGNKNVLDQTGGEGVHTKNYVGVKYTVV